jgi:predicted  nucleic acid-binding Zn-ribbon protein
MKKKIRAKITTLENKSKIAGNKDAADKINIEIADAKVILKQINDKITPILDAQLKDVIK